MVWHIVPPPPSVGVLCDVTTEMQWDDDCENSPHILHDRLNTLQADSLRSEGSRLMQTRRLWAQSGTVCCLRGTPVSQRGLDRLAMSQPVCDGESGVSLQLRQNHQHLSEREKILFTSKCRSCSSSWILFKPKLCVCLNFLEIFKGKKLCSALKQGLERSHCYCQQSQENTKRWLEAWSGLSHSKLDKNTSLKSVVFSLNAFIPQSHLKHKS